MPALNENALEVKIKEIVALKSQLKELTAQAEVLNQAIGELVNTIEEKVEELVGVDNSDPEDDDPEVARVMAR